MTQKTPDHRTIRWGILGLGKIAHEFAQDLAIIPSAKLVAVGSRSVERSKAFAQQYNAPTAHGSYASLAKDPNVDAIYIATPHASHCENTLLCLQHQKAVLCEKPFALNLNQVEKMISASKERNMLLMEALWTRFLPNFQYVLDIVERQKYGRLLTLEADFGFAVPFDATSRLFDKSLGGGSLLDIGIYPVFMALSTMGYPDVIKANAEFGKTGVDERCDIEFDYSSGAKAILKSTFRETTPTEAVLQFEKAKITMHTSFYQLSSLTVATATKTRTLTFDKKGIGYYLETLHFNELLRNGQTESPLMSFDFSRKLMRLLDEIRSIVGLAY